MNLLLATDFSTSSLKAQENAAWLSQKLQAKLSIVNIFPEIRPILGGPYAHREMKPRLDMGQQKALLHAKGLLAKLSKDLSARGTFLRKGKAGPKIVECIDNLKPDLVIMGANHHSSLGRIFVGSVAEYVAKHSSGPILFVPTKGPSEPIRSILFATDFSEHSGVAKGFVQHLCSQLGAKPHVAHVIEPLHGDLAGFPCQIAQKQALKEMALEKLKDVAASFGPTCGIHLLEGDPGPQLVQLSEELKADMTILGHPIVSEQKMRQGRNQAYILDHLKQRILLCG